MIRVGAIPLMSSAVHGSEEAMVAFGCARLKDEVSPRVLIGGLGMGFTLRATLDALGPRASVVVAELLPPLVEWNRGPLAELSKHALDDRRVSVELDDVRRVITRAPNAYDAILLDVDNGPEALTVASNAGLYSATGLASIRAALRPSAKAVFWSAFAAPAFESRLRSAGFDVRAEPVSARGAVKKGSKHWLYVASVRGEKGAPTRHASSPKRPARR